jgi:hypothetical protein
MRETSNIFEEQVVQGLKAACGFRSRLAHKVIHRSLTVGKGFQIKDLALFLAPISSFGM